MPPRLNALTVVLLANVDLRPSVSSIRRLCPARPWLGSQSTGVETFGHHQNCQDNNITARDTLFFILFPHGHDPLKSTVGINFLTSFLVCHPRVNSPTTPLPVRSSSTHVSLSTILIAIFTKPVTEDPPQCLAQLRNGTHWSLLAHHPLDWESRVEL